MKIVVFPNIGNTCYLSCVLQSFIHNDNFKKLISCQNDSVLINELKKITNIIDSTNDGKHLAMMFNLSTLIKSFPFKMFEQQDAHECILSFLDLLSKENLHLTPIYYGQTKSIITCSTCKNIKNIFEEFSSINLVPNKNSNLNDLLRNYIETEVHNSAENLYFCDNCKCLNPYEKKNSFYRVPKVLIIVLKRYTSNGIKINAEITFDKTLTIKESVFGTVLTYTLKSVINHIGNLYNGHYTNFVNNNMWLYIDDESARAENTYDCKNAYILFYEI